MYVQVADELRRDIEGGRLAAGQRLPTWRALAEQYGVAAGTIEKAIEVLRTDGLIEASHGRGTFVRDRQAEPESSAEFVAIMSKIDVLAEELRATKARLEAVESLVERLAGQPASGD